MRKVLNKKFFERQATDVAEDLLGKFLVRRTLYPAVQGRVKEIAVMITETEAYDGPHDLACHASRGRTKRTEAMFGPAGHFYVYLCYGMYWMLNVVTGPEDYPAAVLIRGAREASGPGRLTRELKIDGKLNAARASKETGLWFEDMGVAVPPRAVKKTPRIGVSYAGPVWAGKHYRFILKYP